jgi:hypothetical protein
MTDIPYLSGITGNPKQSLWRASPVSRFRARHLCSPREWVDTLQRCAEPEVSRGGLSPLGAPGQGYWVLVSLGAKQDPLLRPRDVPLFKVLFFLRAQNRVGGGLGLGWASSNSLAQNWWWSYSWCCSYFKLKSIKHLFCFLSQDDGATQSHQFLWSNAIFYNCKYFSLWRT